ncbi:MAG: carbohydrate ABC transporter permease [Clostridia bacterium]|nr:carbohydrate ABC transporter permease [Clostridia bacterium]
MLKQKLFKISMYVVATFVLIIVCVPILWMIISAFKSRSEVLPTELKIFPSVWHFDNFTKVFKKYYDIDFVSSYGSTFMVSIAGMILSLVVNSMAGYAFARIDFPLKKFFWAYVIFQMFIPGISILITSIKVCSVMGMMNTFLVLVLPGVANGYNVFYFRQFFLSMPRSYEEAASLDGLGRFGIYLKIFIPMAVTPLIIIGASVFMGYWNSYLWPSLTVTSNIELKQIMQVLLVLRTRYRSDYGVVVAGTIISVTGPLVIFAIAQKYIVQGITISGIK